MNRIDRIKTMEACLDRSSAAVSRLSEALDEYETAFAGYQKLSDYYGSTKWMDDYEADEAGKLPEDLKRGVLSEDAVYDLLISNNELLVRMAKLIARSIEKKMI